MYRSTILATALLVNCLFALPQGFDLVAGDASPPYIDPHGTMIIDNDGRSIIDWSSFSVGTDEWLYFNQSGVNPAVLNRVVGSNWSDINGRISSNGCVYLINPNGILMGSNGYIETAGFLASTFDLSNQDFLNNAPFHFFGNSAQAVFNKGIIYCPQGNITLCGLTASSTGVMSAPHGTVKILSGEQLVFVKPHGTKNLFVKVDAVKDVSAGKIVSRNGETFLEAR